MILLYRVRGYRLGEKPHRTGHKPRGGRNGHQARQPENHLSQWRWANPTRRQFRMATKPIDDELRELKRIERHVLQDQHKGR